MSKVSKVSKETKRKNDILMGRGKDSWTDRLTKIDQNGPKVRKAEVAKAE